MSLKTKAAFLDRDGVINIDKNYVYKIEDFEFVDGVFDILKYLQKKDFILIVVTNQSGIGRGYYTEEEFQTLTLYMLKELKKNGIDIAKVYHCPHSPEEKCKCRKPAPKMLLDAKKEFDIDMSASIMIGDKKSDIEVGKNANVGTTIYIGDKKEPLADFSINSITEIKKILV